MSLLRASLRVRYLGGLAAGALSVAALLVAAPARGSMAQPSALILATSVMPGGAPDGSGDSLEQYEAQKDGFPQQWSTLPLGTR